MVTMSLLFVSSSECHPSCWQCAGPSADNCTSCPSPSSLYEGRCVPTCPQGFLIQDNQCQGESTYTHTYLLLYYWVTLSVIVLLSLDSNLNSKTHKKKSLLCKNGLEVNCSLKKEVKQWQTCGKSVFVLGLYSWFTHLFHDFLYLPVFKTRDWEKRWVLVLRTTSTQG